MEGINFFLIMRALFVINFLWLLDPDWIAYPEGYPAYPELAKLQKNLLPDSDSD